MSWIRSAEDYAAFSTLVLMVMLLVQFGFGMEINLFVGITRHHPGAGGANFFSGVFDSVSWSIVHGPDRAGHPRSARPCDIRGSDT
jgi:hypothetical protein